MSRKLTSEQIKSITVGALKVWEEKDGFHFSKCTDSQIAAWYSIRETLGERAEATTGVRLDFHTDSSLFAFTVMQGDKYEVYIDNVLKYAYTQDDFSESKKKIYLDGKEHRITLIFPSHTIGILESVEIDDGAVIKPHSFDCKMLFIGDSITQGWNTKWDSLSYAYSVSRFFNASSVIQGIGGAFYHEATFDKDIDYNPDIICIAYGTNDWCNNENITDLRNHISLYLDKLTDRYGDKKIYGISPIWRADKDDNQPMGSFTECCGIVKEEIKKHGMILIEGEYMVPHLPDFFEDGYLHPNDIGFAIYAQNLIMQMQK